MWKIAHIPGGPGIHNLSIKFHGPLNCLSWLNIWLVVTGFLLQLMAVYLSFVTGLYWMNWSIDKNRSFTMLYKTKLKVAYRTTLGG